MKVIPWLAVPALGAVEGVVKAKLPATSYQKLDRAADALIPAFGLTPEEAEGRIKAALPQLGLGATNPSFSQPLATADSSHP